MIKDDLYDKLARELGISRYDAKMAAHNASVNRTYPVGERTITPEIVTKAVERMIEGDHSVG